MMWDHARASPRKAGAISGRAEWTGGWPNEWGAAGPRPTGEGPLPVCLKSALPWHRTTVMSFLGIAAGAAEGLLYGGSETLPSKTLCSGSRRCTLLPGPRGSAPRRPLVGHRHAALLPCTAPGLALAVSHATRPFLSDCLGERNQVCAEEQSHPGGTREKQTNKKGIKKKIPAFSWS